MITLSCTACNGTIARDLEIEAASATTIVFKMAIKCPHCKHPNKVEIRTFIEKQIIVNGRELERGTGEPSQRTIRTLSG